VLVHRFGGLSVGGDARAAAGLGAQRPPRARPEGRISTRGAGAQLPSFRTPMPSPPSSRPSIQTGGSYRRPTNLSSRTRRSRAPRPDPSALVDDVEEGPNALRDLDQHPAFGISRHEEHLPTRLRPSVTPGTGKKLRPARLPTSALGSPASFVVPAYRQGFTDHTARASPTQVASIGAKSSSRHKNRGPDRDGSCPHQPAPVTLCRAHTTG